ncbi:MAG: type II toxin-antitoxin system RelE/ParE family toxin [Pelagimonas sp.]|uniref:type II toxin-antitoxin system RelE/ParE family toxin n=1 Tax=Pelagimonas sp. TaxID=2073170 RepID=UPI003D6C3D9B
MTRAWRLTKQAQDSLVEIAVWTLDTFGPRQAKAYEIDLIERCDRIASGEVLGQDCSVLVGPRAKPERGQSNGLRFVRAGRHFIVYLEASEQIIIIDFLHARCDLPARIAALTSAR